MFERLGICPVDAPTADQWLLTRTTDDRRALTLTRPDGVALSIDFTSGKAQHRTTESGKGAQVLGRALGIKAYVKKTSQHPVIIDATGGLGQDAWALASIGCTVCIIEQHPLIHALLDDAITRAQHHDATALIVQRVSLQHAMAEAVLRDLCAQTAANAIYLDPMYPQKRKSASSKKGMQFLQALLGVPSDEHNRSLLDSALEAGASRVVVKRPKGASALANAEAFNAQLSCVESPNTRFDIYHLHQ